MNAKRRFVLELIEQLDCFGDYTNTDPLCAKHCVLRLGCAIEKERNIQTEIMSDLTSVEGRVSSLQ